MDEPIPVKKLRKPAHPSCSGRKRNRPVRASASIRSMQGRERLPDRRYCELHHLPVSLRLAILPTVPFLGFILL